MIKIGSQTSMDHEHVKDSWFVELFGDCCRDGVGVFALCCSRFAAWEPADAKWQGRQLGESAELTAGLRHDRVGDGTIHQLRRGSASGCSRRGWPRATRHKATDWGLGAGGAVARDRLDPTPDGADPERLGLEHCPRPDRFRLPTKPDQWTAFRETRRARGAAVVHHLPTPMEWGCPHPIDASFSVPFTVPSSIALLICLINWCVHLPMRKALDPANANPPPRWSAGFGAVARSCSARLDGEHRQSHSVPAAAQQSQREPAAHPEGQSSVNPAVAIALPVVMPPHTDQQQHSNILHIYIYIYM